MAEKIATRAAYGEALAALAEEYPELVVLDADLSGSTMSKTFAAKYPDRVYNIGIAEAIWYDARDEASGEEPRTALWLRLAGDNCTLTEAQAGPLADVLREMAGKAEGKA